MRTRLIKILRRTVLIYIIIGGLWILLSDWVLMRFVSEYRLFAVMQTYKGWAFVGVTAVVLYGLLRKQLQRLLQETEDRRLAEEALAESEARYKSLFQNNHAVMLLIDPESARIVDANPAACAYYGWSNAELCQKRIDQINTLSPEAVRQEMESARSQQRNHFFFKHRRADDTIRNVEVYSGPIRIKGKVLLYSIVHDITARVQMEQTLTENEERYRYLFENNPYSMWVYDLETLAFLAVNSATVVQYGYTRDEFLAMTIKDIRPAEDIPRLLEDIARVRPAWQHSGPWRHRLKNGTIIYVDITSHTHTFNGRSAALVIAQNITERVRAEAELQQTTHTLQALVQASPLAIIHLDPEGIVQFWNPAAERIFGWRADEAVGKLLPFVPPDKYAEFEALRAKVVSGQGFQGVELKRQKKDGTLIEISLSTAPMRDEHGDNIGIIGIAEDISARKQLAEENQKLTQQFYQSQKMESVGRLAGGIAHDFNNLLVPIIGFSELGMMDLSQDSKLYADLLRIKQAAERAADLTRQILAFSRRQILTIRVLNLNEVIRQFQKMMQHLIGEHIIVQTCLEPGLQPIKADQTQLEQVLLNLVVNARDAMPRGGTLTIETANVFLDDAFVLTHPQAEPGPYVMLVISDTGHGMDAATQQRIFEPFFSTKDAGHGTGLGLSTVFGIVKQHGGNIWVYSEPGQGATFEIYLPVTEDTAAVEIVQAHQPPDLLQGDETILVVEDETFVRGLVCDTLKAYGYQVLAASGPVEGIALAAAHQAPIHLLLTDVIMPEMNGQELYQQLVAVRSGLKVLYMSGHTDNVIIKQGILKENVVFLQKPFPVHRLLQKVREALSVGWKPATSAAQEK